MTRLSQMVEWRPRCAGARASCCVYTQWSGRVLLALAAVLGASSASAQEHEEHWHAAEQWDTVFADTANLAAWSLSALPRAVLGGVDEVGGQTLWGVRGGHLLQAGGFVILNGNSQELLFFDADGGLVKRLGRRGQGPGEFMLPTRMDRLPGDTLVVWDEGQRRVTLIGPDGSVVSVFSPSNSLLGPEFVTAAWDGLLLFIDRRQLLSGAAGESTGTIVGKELLLTREGAVVDSLGVHPWRRGIVMKFPNGSAGIRAMDFDQPTLYGGSAAGVWIGMARSHEVEWVARGGTHVRLVRWPGSRAPVTGADRQALLEARLARARSPGQEASIRRDHAARPVADFLPVYGQMVVDALGRVWIGPYEVPGRSTEGRWLVLTPSGEAVAALAVPSGLRILDVREGRALVLIMDDFGVERVEVRDVVDRASDAR